MKQNAPTNEALDSDGGDGGRLLAAQMEVVLLSTLTKAQGLSVDEYLKILLGIPQGAEHLADTDFIAAMESLAEENVEPLPRDFSREDIYFPEG